MYNITQLIILLLIVVSNIRAQQQSFDFTIDGKKEIVSNQFWKVNKGDIVSIKASGEITVGLFAGNRTPEGISEYSSNRYNLLKTKPHCGLIVCVTNQNSSQKAKSYWPWEFIGSCGVFIAPEDGILTFDLNESYAWRWDNEPVNGGWNINFKISQFVNNQKGGLKVLGKLKNSPVLKVSNDELIYDCQTFKKGNTNIWKLTNTNGEEIGVCTDTPPYVYALVGENHLSKTGNRNVYLDSQKQKIVLYKGRKFNLAPHDSIWYLLNDNSICEGIARMKDNEILINKEFDFFNLRLIIGFNSIEELLKHINRNFENREAKGRLTYLCSKTYKLTYDYKYFTDQAGNVWLLNNEKESSYHKNPNNITQTALKFTRANPNHLESSFESIRIPLPNENRKSMDIIGEIHPYKVSFDGKEFRSNNLMDTEYRGSYNFQSSTISNIALPSHYLDDMQLHDYYKDYIIFKEQFGTPSINEIKNKAIALTFQLKNNERTCPWDDPWR